MTQEKRPSRGVWLRALLLAVLVAAAGAALWIWRRPIWELFRSQERIQGWIAGFGPLAPLVSIGLNAAQVLLAPIPGQIIGLANGYLYGVWWGTLYAMLGLLVGTTLAMGLGRLFGRPLVERLVDQRQLERLDRIVTHQGPWFFFLFFLIPGLPDDLLCFVIGLSALPLPLMVVLAMLGRLPGVWVSCWVGAHASTLPWWVWIPLGAGTAGLAFAFWRYRNQIEAALIGLIHRLARRRRPSQQDTGESEPECAPEQEAR